MKHRSRINRYDPSAAELGCEMVDNRLGDYIMYDDYLENIRQLHDIIRELRYNLKEIKEISSNVI